MEKVYGLGIRALRLSGKRLQASHEWRDADPAANPDLARRTTLESESAIRAFNAHGIANLEPIEQIAGVITQRFDQEA